MSKRKNDKRNAYLDIQYTQPKSDKLYNVFQIPKKNGKLRTIEAPVPELKARQRADIGLLEQTLCVSPDAHAFHRWRNCATMAKPHVKKPYLVSIDFSNFFPSIDTRFLRLLRVKKDAPLTKRSVEELIRERHMHDFQDGRGRRLPQGAPASPLIANAAMFLYDSILARYCAKHNVDYTRYADDLALSGEEADVSKCVLKAFKLAVPFRLKVNTRKTKKMHQSMRQNVCGVCVNEKLHIWKKQRRKIKAMRFHDRVLTRALVPFPDELRNEAIACFITAGKHVPLSVRLKALAHFAIDHNIQPVTLERAIADAKDPNCYLPVSQRTQGLISYEKMIRTETRHQPSSSLRINAKDLARALLQH